MVRDHDAWSPVEVFSSLDDQARVVRLEDPAPVAVEQAVGEHDGTSPERGGRQEARRDVERVEHCLDDRERILPGSGLGGADMVEQHVAHGRATQALSAAGRQVSASRGAQVGAIEFSGKLALMQNEPWMVATQVDLLQLVSSTH